MNKWKTAILEEVAIIERSSIQPDKIKDGTIYVGLEHIERGGKFTGMQSVDTGDLASSKFQFTESHILYGKLRPYLAKIACPEFRGICSTDILPILPKSNIDRKFLFHFLSQTKMVDYANSQAVGVNLPPLSPSVLANFEIPLPPLEEQRRIAEILDRTQSLISKHKEAIAKLDTLTQSIFIEMFDNPVKNPKEWDIKKFGNIGTFDRGIFKHRPRNAPELLGGKYPLVQTGEVSNCNGYIRTYQNTYSEIGLRQSKLWKAGTLCITIAANIAKTGILTFDACFPDSVVGFLSEESETIEYVRVWLSFLQKTLEETAPESAQKNINLAILRDLNIPFPPLPLQKEFAQRVKAVEKLKATHCASLSQLEALFASLEHRAFRGEL